MYTSFHIKNFRGFEDFELNDLSRINLIAGKNNVGKTALLEALFMYSNPYNPDLTLAVNAFRGMKLFRVEFGKWKTQTPWDTLFPALDTSLKINFTGSHSQLEDWQLAISIVTDRAELLDVGPITKTQPENNGDQGSISAVSDIFTSEVSRVIKLEFQRNDQHISTNYMAIDNRGNKHLMPTPMLPEYQCVFLSSSRERSNQEISERFSDLKRQRKVDLLLNALQIIEHRITDLDLLSDGIYGDFEQFEQLIPLAMMGDGISRLLEQVLAIGYSPGGIVFIDEIENGFHHSILTKVWKSIASVAREFDVQIFATTHSLEMIRAAHEAFKDEEPYDFRLHRLDRDEQTGKITAKTYNEEILEAAVEANFEVR